jgi:hypothetical protein
LFTHQAFAEGRRSRLNFAFYFVGLFGVVVCVVRVAVVVLVAGLFGAEHVVVGGGWGDLVGGIIAVGFGDLVGVIVIVTGVPETKRKHLFKLQNNFYSKITFNY